MKRRIIMVIGLTLLSILLFSLFVMPSRASAPGGGTCCPELNSICYPDGGYPPVSDRYWRTDGKPCSAPNGKEYIKTLNWEITPHAQKGNKICGISKLYNLIIIFIPKS
ncbi:MAG: hypothetical protein ACPLZD_09800 [Candidatus Saccharicenans sp.]|nr:hypothetical protein [Candidatus Aminicenantes bacterium]